jgi:hypothetical protein
LIGISGTASTDEILDFLRISTKTVHSSVSMCPYYCGPVNICILGGVDLHEESDMKGVIQMVNWLMKQPSDRPHWLGNKVLQLGTLLDRTREKDAELDLDYIPTRSYY